MSGKRDGDAQEQSLTGYTATCPVCYAEHDFDTQRAMDSTVKRWRGRVLDLVRRALSEWEQRVVSL